MSEFPDEVLKLLDAFRRKFVCDISHMNILPNGVVVSGLFETKSELIQIAARRITTP